MLTALCTQNDAPTHASPRRHGGTRGASGKGFEGGARGCGNDAIDCKLYTTVDLNMSANYSLFLDAASMATPASAANQAVGKHTNSSFLRRPHKRQREDEDKGKKSCELGRCRCGVDGRGPRPMRPPMPGRSPADSWLHHEQQHSTYIHIRSDRGRGRGQDTTNPLYLFENGRPATHKGQRGKYSAGPWQSSARLSVSAHTAKQTAWGMMRRCARALERAARAQAG
eukprot:scaffold2082_cov111-Isochrysis_galbana.AAC.3